MVADPFALLTLAFLLGWIFLILLGAFIRFIIG